VALGALALPPASPAALPPLAADTSCQWGAAACNPPVSGVLSQFRSMRDHGDVLGYNRGPAPSLSLSKHWQGIQRLMVGQGRFMAVSRSGASTSFVIVRMGSRDTGGERFRSNRLDANVNVMSAIASLRQPPSSDVVASVIPSDPGFDHSGGLQSVGKYLAVGLEEGSRSRVNFWDLSAPATPRMVGSVDHATGVTGAGTTSLARLSGGRYLLIVGGTDANTLDFYVSRPGTTPADPGFDFQATWRESQLRTRLSGDREFGNYQNLALVSDTSGQLFLIGTHRDSISQDDFADLFLLENDATASVRITKVAKRHLYCGVPFTDQQCNFDAAGGAYVTPSRRLLLYGTVHDSDSTGVDFEEFRPVPHRTSCSRIDDAWVELYDDSGFDGDRSLMIDYADRARRDYVRYDRVEDFEDRTSAGAWCLPRGSRYRLYEDKRPCGGDTVDLVGTGVPQSDSDFDDRSGLVRRFGDEVSCSRWMP
jgi:hypothetical protein